MPWVAETKPAGFGFVLAEPAGSKTDTVFTRGINAGGFKYRGRDD